MGQGTRGRLQRGSWLVVGGWTNRYETGSLEASGKGLQRWCSAGTLQCKSAEIFFWKQHHRGSKTSVLLALIAQFFSQEQDRKAEGFSSAKPAPKLPWIGLVPRRAQRSHHQQKKVAE